MSLYTPNCKATPTNFMELCIQHLWIMNNSAESSVRSSPLLAGKHNQLRSGCAFWVCRFLSYKFIRDRAALNTPGKQNFPNASLDCFLLRPTVVGSWWDLQESPRAQPESCAAALCWSPWGSLVSSFHRPAPTSVDSVYTSAHACIK